MEVDTSDLTMSPEKAEQLKEKMQGILNRICEAIKKVATIIREIVKAILPICHILAKLRRKNRKILHLAERHPKYRVRKKNINRLSKAMERGVEKR